MLINTANYFDYVTKVGIENMPPGVKNMHSLIEQLTQKGQDWSIYLAQKSKFDKQFEAVELLYKGKETKRDIPKPEPQQERSEKKSKVERLKPVTERKTERRPDQKKAIVRNESAKSAASPKKLAKYKMPEVKVRAKQVPTIHPEISLIKRYALLHGKTKTKEQILSFIKSIQRAIAEHRITKKSRYARSINEIQSALIKVYNKMNQPITFYFKNADLVRYLKVANSQHILPIVKFIKVFVGMQEKQVTKQRAKNLYDAITKAIKEKSISSKDKYFNHIKAILKALSAYGKNENAGISITSSQLSGLHGVLKQCNCQRSISGFEYEETFNDEEAALSGIEEKSQPQNTILNSLDVIKLQTDKLGFAGKYLDFIGNPSRGFTALIYAKPKFGKSILAVDFAAYLCRNHGRVLYVAREEGFDDTLKEKLKQAAHPNLDVSDYLPKDLSGYDFVFLDSVNKIGLNPYELELIEKKYPKTSFIYIFQSTKDGKIRGGMEYVHNVDVVIEIPEKGRAVQNGRYNQGAELRIF